MDENVQGKYFVESCELRAGVRRAGEDFLTKLRVRYANVAKEMIDFALCLLGGMIGVYLISSIRKKQPKPWFFILLGSIFSALLGYGWALLSIFVFPVLVGTQMSFSSDSEPLFFWTEVSFFQAIPSGVLIFLIGTLVSARHCLKTQGNGKIEELEY